MRCALQRMSPFVSIIGVAYYRDNSDFAVAPAIFHFYCDERSRAHDNCILWMVMGI